MEQWRYDLVGRLLGLAGKVWYEWGGQQVGPYGGAADCSGLVVRLLQEAGRLPEGYDATADQLARRFARTAQPLPGDLAFYGRANKVAHVMFYLGDVAELSITDGVAGMCFGRLNMHEAQAKLVGANLWIRRAGYRGDFLHFGRVA